MHPLEAEDADRVALLLCPWVVGVDTNSLEGVEVADFVGDRVLGHCREGAEGADRAGTGGGLPLQPRDPVMRPGL